MGLLANSAFSRSLIIRLSEAYSHRSYPFAIELMEEKVIAGIRNSAYLRISGIRLTLDNVVHREHEIKIHASNILGFGLTARLVKKAEYETEVQIIVCDKKLERIPILEKEFLNEVKEALYIS
jgi:hypothetical protein